MVSIGRYPPKMRKLQSDVWRSRHLQLADAGHEDEHEDEHANKVATRSNKRDPRDGNVCS